MNWKKIQIFFTKSLNVLLQCKMPRLLLDEGDAGTGEAATWRLHVTCIATYLKDEMQHKVLPQNNN